MFESTFACLHSQHCDSRVLCRLTKPLVIMEEFCKSLPKIELHAHLNGSLSTETLASLGTLQSNVQEYQKLTTILTKTHRTLDECFQLFNVAHQATNNVHAVYQATQSVIKEFHDDGVIYLELRTTPREETNMSRKDYIQSVVKAIQNSCNELSIIVKLILCLDRKFDADLSREVMNLIIEMHQAHPDVIVGVDLCGNPKIGNFSKEEFVRARNAGLKVTLHCAEVKSDSEEWDILEFQPDRLGHGTFLHPEKGNNEKTFSIDMLKNIPLEICLSSNNICGTVDDYSKHHINKWMEHKLPFCLCTDDKGVFMCDLSKEYLLAHQHYNLSAEDLYNVSIKAIEYTFSNDEIKQQLRVKFAEWKAQNFLNK